MSSRTHLRLGRERNWGHGHVPGKAKAPREASPRLSSPRRSHAAHSRGTGTVLLMMANAPRLLQDALGDVKSPASIIPGSRGRWWLTLLGAEASRARGRHGGTGYPVGRGGQGLRGEERARGTKGPDPGPSPAVRDSWTGCLSRGKWVWCFLARTTGLSGLCRATLGCP